MSDINEGDFRMELDRGDWREITEGVGKSAPTATSSVQNEQKIIFIKYLKLQLLGRSMWPARNDAKTGPNSSLSRGLPHDFEAQYVRKIRDIVVAWERLMRIPVTYLPDSFVGPTVKTITVTSGVQPFYIPGTASRNPCSTSGEMSWQRQRFASLIQERILALESMAQPKGRQVAHSRKDFFVKGKVNGSSVEALPDTGAGASFISPQLAAKLELHTDTRRKKSIRLATGELVYSPGTVNVKWRFDGESEDVDMKCWVLPKCIHDIILGKGFLEMTRTLTNFKNRIKSKISAVSHRLRLRFVDGQLPKSQHLRGYLNGQSTLALADTGSDAMFVSKSYATKRGFDVDKDPSIQYEVEFANGSTQWTTGVVHGATWTLGGQTTRCDLLVLDGLSEDLILNKDYLFEEDVYTAHRDLFTDYEIEEDDFYHLLNIRLLGRYKRSLNDVEQGYLDESLEDDFGRDMLDKELVRRDTISDHIATLPQWQREAAYQAEAERQRLWQIEREARGMRAVHALPAVQPPNPQDRAHAQGTVSARRLRLLEAVLGTSSAKTRLLRAKNSFEAVRTSVVTRAASWKSKDEDAVVISLHGAMNRNT